MEIIHKFNYNSVKGVERTAVMTNEEYGRIIAKNLKRIMYAQGKKQTDVARDLNISTSTLSSWMNAQRTPKMDKIDMLCRYFNCERTDIMEEHDYYAPGTAQAAQELFDSDLRALMDAARDCPPEVIRSAADLLRKFKETNPDG